jgi:hypothetical protein
MFEFLCDNGHISDQLVDDSVRTTLCRECGEEAIRQISSPRIALEGITGAFPGAADKWVKKRAEKLKQEQKTAASNA